MATMARVAPAPQPDAWYAVQVAARREKTVAGLLSTRGYEGFLPMAVSKLPATGRNAAAPLFPGYVFCRINFADMRAPVVTTPGVIRVLGIAGVPTPVNKAEIDHLKTIVTSGLPAASSPPQIGERVRITTGPLSGVEGVLCGVKKNRRLAVTVTILQRWVTVDVEDAFVVPAGASSESAITLLARQGRLREFVCTAGGWGQ